MFADPEIAVIQTVRGGFGSAEIVPLLDFDAIAASPKPFVGLSDITALHAALLRLAGLATFYGPSLTMMGARRKLTNDRLLQVLRGETTGPVPYDPDESHVRAIAGGRASGSVVGGCLPDLLHTMGTPWEFQTEGAILFFDEADALFGKRSEVKDSHDRYANIEVNYLLQRMECYRGLAVLATNMRSALDTAFLRRIRFVINFPFPEFAQRADIWQRVFPPTLPTEQLEINMLARLPITGGNIRNIALNAAFLAAEDGVPVKMVHLAQAARGEFAKLERPLPEAEIRDWA